MPASRRRNRLVRLAINLAFAPLASGWPRSPRHWVFGHAGEAFAGNPKFLFLWLHLHRPDIAATWITGSDRTHRMLRDQGLPVARRWSRRGILAALRARVYAFSHDPADVNAALARGAYHLNLWHGVGIKALHAGARPARGARAWLRGFLYPPYQMVVSTSAAMQAHFAAEFRLAPEACPQLGYPRNDWSTDRALAGLARTIDRREGFALMPPGYDEVYLYLPTFRDTGRPFLQEALPDLAALEGVLRARRALLYIKPHPLTADTLGDAGSSIRRWPEGIDFQPYLADLTGLITDYSSVLYDYLAVRRSGAILYTFDRDRYVGGDRALVEAFDTSVAGVRVDTFADLCAVIASGGALDPAGQGDVDGLFSRFWGGSPSPSSPAVVAHVEAALATAAAVR